MTVKEIQSVMMSCRVLKEQEVKEDLGLILVRRPKMHR